jgi:glycerol-3-phosphate cytidylyltransferase
MEETLNLINNKVVYTGGTFDLFHYGHVNLLKTCSKIGGKVVVSLNTDDFIFRYKGSYPVIPYKHRKSILLSCKYVNEVIPNENGEDSKPTILKINPDFIVIGSDWAKKDYYKQMNFTQEWLDSHGITLLYTPYTNSISTTQIKNIING